MSRCHSETKLGRDESLDQSFRSLPHLQFVGGEEAKDSHSQIVHLQFVPGKEEKEIVPPCSLRASSSGDSTEVQTGDIGPRSTHSNAMTNTRGLLAANSRDSSPYSNASAVKPRLIPFGDGSTLSKKRLSEEGSHIKRDLEQEGESQVETPELKTNGRTPQSSLPTQKRSHVSVHESKQEVPSVVEESNDTLNVSAISWKEEAVKVGQNSYLAKHTDPNNVILYQVISKEEAGALIEGQMTFDTEAPLLSHSVSEEIKVNSGTSARRFAEPRLNWKLRTLLCVAGTFILAAGLFVGIAVALLNVETTNRGATNSTGTTESQEFEPTAPTIRTPVPTGKTTSIPTLSPSITIPKFPALSTASQTPPSTEIEFDTTSAPTFKPAALPTSEPTGLPLVPASKPTVLPLVVPSSEPTAFQSASIYDALQQLPSHSWEAMANSTSHHSRSFSFLQQDPSLESYSRERIIQRFVMSVLFYSTEGENWSRNDSWLSYDVHECEWWAVTCGLDEEVVNITLKGNALAGSLPYELSLLTALLHLDLSDNKIGDEIPGYLGDLVDLESLSLQNNAFVGPLPGELGKLTSLKSLNLTSNLLSGGIPFSEWRTLSGLSRLGLAENRLTGNLTEELGMWTNLAEMCVQKNRLKGSITVQIGKLTQLRGLMLYDNELSGRLPSEIALLEQLTDLELDANGIEKSIPSELGLLTNLENLWLSSNMLTGWIPSEFGKLTALRGLYMQVNQLTGLLPSELGVLEHLQEMRLFENQLRGALPSELGNLGSLEQLSLGWNTFSGFIFTEIGRLQQLREIDLVANNLDGTIVSTIGSLSKLENLWLFSNNLEHSIPTEVGNLSMLDQMLLFWNWLTGPIPSEVGLVSNLSVLSLESNQLTKTIPSQLGNLSGLNWLMLYDNNLTGEVPSEIGMLRNLTWLRLEMNRGLRGTIPEELGDLTALEHVAFQGTALSGIIPSYFCPMIAADQLVVGIECNEVSCDCDCMCYNSFT